MNASHTQALHQPEDKQREDETKRVEHFYGKDRFLQPQAPVDKIKVFTYNVSLCFHAYVMTQCHK